MVRIEFALDLRVVNVAPTEDLQAGVGRIMDELLHLEATDCGISDSAVSLDFDQMMVTVEVVATGTDFDAARQTADSCVRTAIHASGGGTPHWSYAIQGSVQRLEPEYA